MLKIDTSDFLRAAASLDRAIAQLPFAFSRALNDAAKESRGYLIGTTWPTHVTVRKKSFLPWALRTEYATKSKLWIEVSDERAQGHGQLSLHDTGGVKVARGRLAIPGKFIRRGANGVITSQRPRNLQNTFVRDGVILQRVGPKNPYYVRKTNSKRGKAGSISTNSKFGKGGVPRGLRVMYVLRSSADIKADVPFHKDFERIFRQSFAKNAPRRIAEAFATMR